MNQPVKKLVLFLLFAIAELGYTRLAHANNGAYIDSIKYTDAHLHYVDFIQHTDGAQYLIAQMDKASLQDAMIAGLPLIKKWSAQSTIHPVYYLDNDTKLYYYSLTDEIVARDILALPKTQQKRLHPFICGFNPTDENSVDHVIRMMKWYPNFWQGIGEIITRHGALTELTEGSIATANNKALYPVYDFAAKHHLPVLIHSDIGTIWVPQDSSSAHSPIYIAEIEEAIKSHPQTIFIWAHGGMDRNINIPNYIGTINNLLLKYPNLYIDISGFTLRYILHNGKPDKDWLKLLNHFSNHIFLGTDAVGHFSNYQQQINDYKIIFNALPPEVAKKIAKTNFLAILPKY